MRHLVNDELHMIVYIVDMMLTDDDEVGMDDDEVEMIDEVEDEADMYLHLQLFEITQVEEYLLVNII
jgi:hypothetical protein